MRSHCCLSSCRSLVLDPYSSWVSRGIRIRKGISKRLLTPVQDFDRGMHSDINGGEGVAKSGQMVLRIHF
ncbi:hypothetical protein J437_LFUL011474 [Ladona fulva]|uniref:Uncharacterized protein n=1 Tax=Ladona fulva TaxID=123851 RepID=A0A8K0P446_LADFU|nr:hypothetical protein J437_LFUL011474 [Ladona fulva]